MPNGPSIFDYLSKEFVNNLTPEARKVLSGINVVLEPMSNPAGTPRSGFDSETNTIYLTNTGDLNAAQHEAVHAINMNLPDKRFIGSYLKNFLPASGAFSPTNVNRMQQAIVGSPVSGQFENNLPFASLFMPEQKAIREQYLGDQPPAGDVLGYLVNRPSEEFATVAENAGFRPYDIPENLQSAFKGVFKEDAFRRPAEARRPATSP